MEHRRMARGFLRPSSGKGPRRRSVIHSWCRLGSSPFVYKSGGNLGGGWAKHARTERRDCYLGSNPFSEVDGLPAAVLEIEGLTPLARVGAIEISPVWGGVPTAP